MTETERNTRGTKNFLFLGGHFRLQYAYLDLYNGPGFVADSLFYRRKIPVEFRGEMVKEGVKYCFVRCRIKRKYRQLFEEALAEISCKMSLLGHNDYDAFCEELIGGVLAKAKDE